MSQLDREGHELKFKNGSVYIDNVLFGRISEKLYRTTASRLASSTATPSDDHDVMVVDSFEDSTAPSTFVSNTIDLLHRRYGHADIQMIRRLIDSGAVTGLGISDRTASPKTFHCDACKMAKMVKLKRIKSMAINRGGPHNRHLYFSAVYSDVLGPLQPIALGGYRYAVTFTEEQTRFRFYYPLKSKSDVLQAFKRLVTEVEALGFKVRLLRSDNGGEYQNQEFESFCVEQKISQRFNPPNTPAANSVSERYNRVLEERARAMLNGSFLPKCLWSVCMQTVTFLYNRSLGPMHSTMTPYELLYGVRPDVSHLRAYGCVTYMYDFSLSRQKLDNTALRGVLVGYDNNSSSYLVYVPSLRSIRRSGHCRFNEHAYYYTAESLALEEIHLEQLNAQSATKAARSKATAAKLPAAARRKRKPTDTIQPTTDNQSESPPESGLAPTVTPEEPALPQPAAAPPPTAVPEVPDTPTDTTAVPPQPPTAVPTAPVVSPATRPAATSNKRSRPRRIPSRLADFKLFFTSQEEDFSVEALLAASTDTTTSVLDDAPTSFESIEERADKAEWYRAVQSENASMKKRNVLTPVDIGSLPAGTNIIKAKFIFRRKIDGRYKARLVAKGFSQKFGVDYYDVFSPVVSKLSLRALLSIAAVEDFHIHQMDVETAFLYGDIDEDLYMEAPTGAGYPPGTILKLNKSLYGLKQAPRQWNKALHSWLLSQGFSRSLIDSGIYMRGTGADAVFLAVYVDDLLMFGHDLDYITDFKVRLNQQFTIKDFGEVRNILGMCVTRDRQNRTIRLDQTDYIRKLVEKFRLSPDRTYSPKPIPISKATVRSPVDPAAPSIEGIYPFRSAIGGLLYANMCTRPDISYAVSSLASHNSNPKKVHWLGVMELLKYISDTQDLAITYGGPHAGPRNQLEVYADANFSKVPDIVRSRTGYVIYLNGGPIAWYSSCQKTVAMSTTESEMYAMYDAVNQALWFKEFLGEIGFVQNTITCHEDNSGLLDWINNQKNSSRMKSIELKYYKLREYKEFNICNFIHVSTALQKADIFTKQLDFATFYQQICLLFNIRS